MKPTKPMLAGLLGLALTARPVQATLIRNLDTILDTTTGIRWFPVSPASGALAVADLPSDRRYATVDEVDTLLDTYLRPLCLFARNCTQEEYEGSIGTFLDRF